MMTDAAQYVMMTVDRSLSSLLSPSSSASATEEVSRRGVKINVAILKVMLDLL